MIFLFDPKWECPVGLTVWEVDLLVFRLSLIREKCQVVMNGDQNCWKGSFLYIISRALCWGCKHMFIMCVNMIWEKKDLGVWVKSTWFLNSLQSTPPSRNDPLPQMSLQQPSHNIIITHVICNGTTKFQFDIMETARRMRRKLRYSWEDNKL